MEETMLHRTTARRERRAAIRRRRILCSNEHSKLCFGQPEMIRASQNKLATRLKAREGFPPKSEIHDVKSETENLNAYGRKQ